MLTERSLHENCICMNFSFNAIVVSYTLGKSLSKLFLTVFEEKNFEDIFSDNNLVTTWQILLPCPYTDS